MNINEQLEELYKNGKQNLDKIPISNENPTNPLLLYVDEQCFKKTKVMLFGQETNDSFKSLPNTIVLYLLSHQLNVVVLVL